MKTKRLSAILCMALCALLAVCPCARASTADTDLARLTAGVKERLGIGDDYTDFTSEYNDYSGRRLWYLNWYGDDGALSVSCLADGTVCEYNLTDYGYEETYSAEYAPSFPTVTREDCRPTAEAFLATVIGGNEGWILQDVVDGPSASAITTYYFYGNLTRNGYKTDQTFSLNVRISDMTVTSYWRSDLIGAYDGWNLPATLSDAAAARALLEAAYGMELRYVRDGENAAKLVYVPVQDGPAYVDATTGEPVDLEDAYTTLNASETGEGDMGTADYSEDFIARDTLTETELSGIELLNGALSREELDGIVRSYPEFGMDGFILTDLNVSSYEDGLHAHMTYMREMSREMLEERYHFDGTYLDSMYAEGKAYCVTRYFTIDALTGELESYYTYYPYSYGEYSYSGDKDEARQSAEAFLSAHYPEIAGNMQLYWDWFDEDSSYYAPNANFEYVRLVNGIPFYDDTVSVTVNVDTGEIDGLYYYWEDLSDVSFGSADNVITPEQALSSYLMHYELEVSYLGKPTAYADYNYTYTALLCYSLVADESLNNAYLSGVDANSGECLIESYGVQPFSYTDIASCPQSEAVQALAAHGIGFEGGQFLPDDELTLRDMLVLLLQAGAYSDAHDYTDEDLISIAGSWGIPVDAGADAAATVTRTQMARTLIAMSGYGEAASFSSIFKCGFADDDLIAHEDYGYIAIAKGLGIAQADENGNFRPYDIVTRGEAAAMLYAFLTRPV